MNPKLKKYQIAMRRSTNGKVLGVFTGIAESLGRSVCGTRFLGIVILMCIASAFGVEGFTASLLAVGFFYLLLAMLMRPPLAAGERVMDDDPDVASVYTPRRETRPRSFRPAAVPYMPGGIGRRVDLGQLDSQLDSLNRRIQRMETIVTDRQYDWDRRMNS